MNGTKAPKWHQIFKSKLLQAVTVSLSTALIVKVVEKYGRIELMKSLFQTFFIELWPIWLGIGAGLIYLAIREIISIHNFLSMGVNLNKQNNKLNQEKRDFMTNFSNTQNGIMRRLENIEKTISTITYRDREEPRSSPLPHHRTYGSVYGDSAGQGKYG